MMATVFFFFCCRSRFMFDDFLFYTRPFTAFISISTLLDKIFLHPAILYMRCENCCKPCWVQNNPSYVRNK